MIPGPAGSKNVKVGNDQEMGLSERNYHSKNRSGKTYIDIKFSGLYRFLYEDDGTEIICL